MNEGKLVEGRSNVWTVCPAEERGNDHAMAALRAMWVGSVPTGAACVASAYRVAVCSEVS